MKVYIAEKKSQGHDLASVLNGNDNFEDKKTYIKLDNKDVVTWCSGHLLTLAQPEDYSLEYKKWSLDKLPILPEKWLWLPIERVKYQLETIKNLLKYADEAVICSDYDREGQLLAVNVLNYCNYTGKASRVKLTATDKTSIKRALDNIDDLNNTMSLYNSALARIKSDWAVGLNLTRLFTCLSNESNCSNNNVINIGRVITPTINLVVERDLEIKNFKPREFYEIEADVAVKNGSFKMALELTQDLCGITEQHCFDRNKINEIFKKIDGKNLTITSMECKESQELPPLPFSLSKLQIYASRRFNLSPKETLDICQSLYDSRNKLTTYPRSDCQYLPESQFDDVPVIMQNLEKDGSEFIKSLIAGADLTLKSRAFSDRKMQNHAHNAIIPSLGEQSTSNLNDNERKIYESIVLHYIAQFYPPAVYDVAKITASCEGYNFIATGKILKAPGYRICFKDTIIDDDDEGKSSAVKQKLPIVKSGEIGYFKNLEIVNKTTRAPKRFDNASLIEAMTNVGRFVESAEDKKILDETYGLGTEPTRPVIIENMIKYGWVKLKDKHFEATDKAIKTMAALPKTIKSPSMTAVWEKALDEIANSHKEPVSFELAVADWIKKVLQTCTSENNKEKLIKMLGDISEIKDKGTVYKCELCQSPLKLIDGRYGRFFVCSNSECAQRFQEANGKPLPLYNEETAPKCPLCSSGLKLIKAKTGKLFWKCQNDNCAALIPDMRGKPKPGELCSNCNKQSVFRMKGKFGFFNKCIACNSIFKINGKKS